MSEKTPSQRTYDEVVKFENAVEKIKAATLSLDLSGMGLTSIPEEITQLRGLTQLNLSENNLTTLPESITQLTNLSYLDLSKNSISALPNSVTQLTKLQKLNLHYNNLIELPGNLVKLENLEVLNLSDNSLTSLPNTIGDLKNLQELNLYYNSLRSLPDTIGKLTNLQSLNLSDNNLSSLPDTIIQLTNLQIFDLRQNHHLPIPPELIGEPTNPQAILTYWYARQQNDMRPLNEAKLILVGQGSVGKTSLVQRLLFNDFKPDQNTTKGIQISSWYINLELPEGVQQYIHLHLWDFGGQEIMHATHQFFLTQRTLYLLVVDARQGEHESRVEYWLALISSFAGDSPILIVVNKSDLYYMELNRRGLQQKYPKIVGFIHTSAATGVGIIELRGKIRKTLLELPHLDTLFPRVWWAVKGTLEELQRVKDFISYEEYRQMCVTAGLSDDNQQRTLISFMHDLGIVINFQSDDRVRDTNILNPAWVTEGVYALITSQKLAQNNGVLARHQVSELLDPVRYPPERQGFILRMMEKFELAYPLEGGKDYLIPDLLPMEESIRPWSDSDALKFSYHYHVLPHNILHRFMVRQHDKINSGIIWRTGVMLTYEGMDAFIKADIEGAKIQIHITGNGRRREFLGMLRFTFASIHKNLTGAKPEEYVPVPGYPGVTIPYTFLLELENENEAFTRWPGVAEKINVQALLGTIETPIIRQQATLSRREILDRLSDALNQEEARTLCFDLGVDYADLPGEGRVAKLRELVVLLERRGRIPELLSALNQLS